MYLLLAVIVIVYRFCHYDCHHFFVMILTIVFSFIDKSIMPLNFVHLHFLTTLFSLGFLFMCLFLTKSMMIITDLLSIYECVAV